MAQETQKSMRYYSVLSLDELQKGCGQNGASPAKGKENSRELGHMTYEEKLRGMGLFSLEKWRWGRGRGI